ncbi:MAG: phosphate acetyltransferase [Rhodobacterales bacterium]|nr:MAG: phosphate acetyltransferase [Rhodobacterales bacterium]
MPKSVYIASTGRDTGKSIVVFGMMEYLLGRSHRIGYFKPIATDSRTGRTTMSLVSENWKSAVEGRVVAAYTQDEAEEIQARDGIQALHKGILEAYAKLAERCDFVLCSGTNYTRSTSAFEFEFNLDIAKNLGAALLPVFNGREISTKRLIEQMRALLAIVDETHTPVLATVVNRIEREALDKTRKALAEAFKGKPPIFVLRNEPSLLHPTVRDIAAIDGAIRLSVDRQSLGREVQDIKVAAMAVPNFLSHLTEGALVITSGDRADILTSCLLVNRSPNFPDIAGLVLTGGLLPEESVMQLMTGAGRSALPILAMNDDTFTAVQKIEKKRGWLSPKEPKKLATAVKIFQDAADLDSLHLQFEPLKNAPITPLMFEQKLLMRASANRKRIVLPEGEDRRILHATTILKARGVAEIVLLGNVDTITRRAADNGLSLRGVELIDPSKSPLLEGFVTEYAALRAHKGVTLPVAKDRMMDPAYFGTMMVHRGEADGMVSGARSTTAHTIRPSFEFIKTRPGVSLVSSVFLMCLEDRVLVYGDCAVNPKPTARELADIAISAAGTSAMFDIEPRIAMLSYSSGTSGHGEEVDRVREATRIVREKRPDLAVEGPIQYDAASEMDVARSKMPGSEVAGRATVFIFPDLNSGNNAYKAVQRTARAVAIGPVLQGLNKPVNDLSRGCTVTDIVNTVAITAIQAQEK